jgi:para-nitrobenzyl esterase
VLPDHSPLGIWRAVAGDLVFQNPTTCFARLHARYQPVYKYLYGTIEPDELGAPHGAEVGEVWHRSGMDTSQLPVRQIATDIKFAQELHDVWVSFIRDAAPVSPAGVWPAYDASSPGILRMEKGIFHVTDDPFDGRVALWDRADA